MCIRDRLKSGKMPAPAHIVPEEIVGPSLGQESINAGIFSYVVALILLMTNMCSMYGFIPGMVANCALILDVYKRQHHRSMVIIRLFRYSVPGETDYW